MKKPGTRRFAKRGKLAKRLSLELPYFKINSFLIGTGGDHAYINIYFFEDWSVYLLFDDTVIGIYRSGGNSIHHHGQFSFEGLNLEETVSLTKQVLKLALIKAAREKSFEGADLVTIRELVKQVFTLNDVL